MGESRHRASLRALVSQLLSDLARSDVVVADVRRYGESYGVLLASTDRVRVSFTSLPAQFVEGAKPADMRLTEVRRWLSCGLQLLDTSPLPPQAPGPGG